MTDTIKVLRKLLLPVILSGLVISCSKEEAGVRSETPELSSSAMKFSSYLERPKNSIPDTKAEEDDTLENPLGEGGSFNMKAYYNADASTQQIFFSCVEFTWDDKQYFRSSPTYYWPVSGNVDFYAASPTAFEPDSVMDITIDDGKKDLIAAKALARTKTSAVALTFGHKLTRLSFKAVGTSSKFKYEISSISVNANSKGKYHFGGEESGLGRWTDSSSPEDYEFLDTTLVIPAGTSSSNPVAGRGNLMLVPPQTSVILSVTYEAKDGNVTVASGTKTVDISSSLIKWDINKHITYLLTLTIDDTPITFNGEITDWNTEITEYYPPHYIDNGVDYGAGVIIDSLIWAPVNCGYEKPNGDYKGYPYGKLYQWGRKDGHGYDTNDATTPTLVEGQTADPEPNVFYFADVPKQYNWYNGSNPMDLWIPRVKTSYDPCPTGWRVPTTTECKALVQNQSSITEKDGQKGVYFSGGIAYSSSSTCLFLPLAGSRNGDTGHSLRRDTSGRYWTSLSTSGKAPCISFFSEIPTARVDHVYSKKLGFPVRCVWCGE